MKSSSQASMLLNPYTSEGKTLINIAYPVKYLDKFIGAVVCNLDVSKLQGKLESIANPDTGSFHCITDQNGFILANTANKDAITKRFKDINPEFDSYIKSAIEQKGFYNGC